MSKITMVIFTLLNCFSQNNDENSFDLGHKVQITTHQIIVYEGGSLNEAIELVKEWTDKVLKVNENFKSIKLLISDTASDTVYLPVIYEYKENPTRGTG